jgi:hypothetical protein
MVNSSTQENIDNTVSSSSPDWLTPRTKNIIAQNPIIKQTLPGVPGQLTPRTANIVANNPVIYQTLPGTPGQLTARTANIISKLGGLAEAEKQRLARAKAALDAQNKINKPNPHGGVG